MKNEFTELKTKGDANGLKLHNTLVKNCFKRKDLK